MQSIAVIGIMIPLLNTPMTDTAHDILACGILLELLGLLFLVSLPFPHSSEGNHVLAQAFLVSAYTIPIIIGILGLSTAITIEYVKVSVALAMGMSCILVVGVMLWILAWVLKAFGLF